MTEPGDRRNVGLGRQGRVALAWHGGRIVVRLNAQPLLRLTRRQAWQLAEALDALATAAQSPKR